MKSISPGSFSLGTTGRLTPPPASDPTGSGQASLRDNVVFEAGLFGGVLGMRRTFILHASGSKLPSDLLGLTCMRYEGRVACLDGLWWQFSLTERSAREPPAVVVSRMMWKIQDATSGSHLIQ